MNSYKLLTKNLIGKQNVRREILMSGSAGVPPANNNEQTSQSPESSQPPESSYKGWHSRGYLPHFDCGEISQFITFRLTGLLPAELLNSWRAMLDHLSKNEAEAELRDRIEEHLDHGTGHTWLKNPAIASVIQNALFHFDGQRYRLHSWVVMPNHIHILLTPAAGYGIPGIVHSLKSFTSNEANRLLDRKGEFWHVDYYDRYIRTEEHYYRTVEYIEMNPVKAGLCENRDKWEFSSAAMTHKNGRNVRSL
jgi:REP element-mobilizing transposase RayT